jgi:hypothetical protein
MVIFVREEKYEKSLFVNVFSLDPLISRGESMG